MKSIKTKHILLIIVEIIFLTLTFGPVHTHSTEADAAFSKFMHNPTLENYFEKEEAVRKARYPVDILRMYCGWIAIVNLIPLSVVSTLLYVENKKPTPVKV